MVRKRLATIRLLLAVLPFIGFTLFGEVVHYALHPEHAPHAPASVPTPLTDDTLATAHADGTAHAECGICQWALASTAYSASRGAVLPTLAAVGAPPLSSCRTTGNSILFQASRAPPSCM